jgi:hypothetical protein
MQPLQPSALPTAFAPAAPAAHPATPSPAAVTAAEVFLLHIVPASQCDAVLCAVCRISAPGTNI